MYSISAFWETDYTIRFEKKNKKHGNGLHNPFQKKKTTKQITQSVSEKKKPTKRMTQSISHAFTRTSKDAPSPPFHTIIYMDDGPNQVTLLHHLGPTRPSTLKSQN